MGSYRVLGIQGTIVPTDDGSRFNREAWCRLIDSRPELSRPQPRQGINPFTREPMVFRPSKDAAEVIVDGVVVGNASWSMAEDEPLVNVCIERLALSLVLVWASELGGKFCETPSPANSEA